MTRSRKATEQDSPRLPHERDESDDSQSGAPRDVLKRAHDDIEEGQQDTDRRGTRGFEKPENRLQRKVQRKESHEAERNESNDSGAHRPASEPRR